MIQDYSVIKFRIHLMPIPLLFMLIEQAIFLSSKYHTQTTVKRLAQSSCCLLSAAYNYRQPFIQLFFSSSLKMPSNCKSSSISYLAQSTLKCYMKEGSQRLQQVSLLLFAYVRTHHPRTLPDSTQPTNKMHDCTAIVCTEIRGYFRLVAISERISPATTKKPNPQHVFVIFYEIFLYQIWFCLKSSSCSSCIVSSRVSSLLFPSSITPSFDFQSGQNSIHFTHKQCISTSKRQN